MPCWSLDNPGTGKGGRCFAAILQHKASRKYVIQFHDGAIYELEALPNDNGTSAYYLNQLAQAPNPGWWWNHVIRPRLGEFGSNPLLPIGHYDTLYGQAIPPLSDVINQQH
jgi:hypothetical protein